MKLLECHSMQNFMEELHKVKNSGGKLVCFGASAEGVRALEHDLKNIGVDYFCDNDAKKQGGLFSGIPVLNPEKLKDEKDVIVLITSIFVNEITKQLQSYGIDNIWYSMLLSYRHIIYDSRIIEENRKMIDATASILADEQSANVFNTIIRHRQTQNLDLLCDILDNEEYFRKDIFKFTDEEVYVDGGAYTGDTIYKFMHAVDGKFRKIYAFEPDDISFSILKKNFMNYDNVLILKKGLYDSETTIGFKANGIGSRIDDALEFQIETCNLDETIKEKVTFIKMDIEGAELRALDGAKEIILRDKPKLAICVYHKPEDLWEIPQAIHDLLPEYKIYMRHHSPFWDDTVVYATI